MIAINLRGTFLCIREAVQRMTEPNSPTGCAIVNVSSFSVRTGGAGNHIDYAAAKAGVEAMTVGFARELARKGIRVNAVAPGTTDTDMSATIIGPARARVEANIPMQRFATPEELAESILWLLSPSASYVTGAVLLVAGGR
jgi:NAD(P)-dependent dehydrogenase (short-subunit alcohol dehydrogenase family)